MLVMSSELKSSTTTAATTATATTTTTTNSKIKKDDLNPQTKLTTTKMPTSTAISPAGADDDDDDDEEEDAGVVTHDEDSNVGVVDKLECSQKDTDKNHRNNNNNNNSTSTMERNSQHKCNISNKEPKITTATKEQQQQGGGEKTSEEKGGQAMQEGGDNGTAPDQNITESVPTVVVETPLPLLKGTLTYNLESRKHILRGNWNYDYSKTPPALMPTTKVPAQRFELTRTFPPNTPEEDIKRIPSDGEFQGSFSLVYYIVKNNKTRERSKVVQENGVRIQFEPTAVTQQQQQQLQQPLIPTNEFKVTGRGMNQYGEFQMYGTAIRSSYQGEQDTFHVEVTKRYVTTAIPATAPAPDSATMDTNTTVTDYSNSNNTTNKKRPADDTSSFHDRSGRKLKYDDTTSGDSVAPTAADTNKDTSTSHDGILLQQPEDETLTLPPPTPSFPSGVVCLRGKLFRDKAEQLGVQENLHRIQGLWSTGLDILLSDPNNQQGLSNIFDYEHKSIDEKNDTFPLSGRYTGYFFLTNEDKTTTRIPERDVFLKFKLNSAGGYNVEGKGSNVFGKYTISGTMEAAPPTTAENDTDNEMDNNSSSHHLGTAYIITIFRHFLPRKSKKEKKSIEPIHASSSRALLLTSPGTLADTLTVTENNHSSSALSHTKEPKVTKPETLPEFPALSLDEIVIPSLTDFVPTDERPTFVADAIVPPEHGSYSAVSRGVLRMNTDGAHTCAGKWAISREHFANNIASSFHFGLEAHIALDEAKRVLDAQGRLPDGADTALPSDLPIVFPLDSAQYKGSFRLKRGANKFSTFVDKQIVLKFVKNSSGSFNVYGKGCNNLGQFDLIGTLIQQGQSSGQVELYRIYSSSSSDDRRATTSSSSSLTASLKVSELLVPTQQQQPITNSFAIPALPTSLSDVSTPATAVKTFASPRRKETEILTVPTSMPILPLAVGSSATPMVGFQRTESGRSVKLPSRLEDSDPDARRARIMEKCNNILRILRDQDAVTGRFFAEPVDPVALGIPTYSQIIVNPMDLGTIQLRMNSGQIEDHEEFARLVRLVFENAMKFNVDPTHSVHVRARDLLLLFNRKFADVERIATSINEKRRLSKSELKAKQREEKRKEKIAAKEAKRKAREEKADKKKRQKTETEELPPNTLAPLPTLDVISSASLPTTVEGYATKSEFEVLYEQIRKMQLVIVAMQQQLAAVGAPSVPMPTMPSLPLSGAIQQPSAISSSSSPDKATTGKSKAKGKTHHKKLIEEEVDDVDEELKHKPLSLKEQEQLSDAINRLTGKRLDEAIRIIKESTHISDEGEIDLEIDQLDNPTQRKLQSFVLKVSFVLLIYHN